MIKAGDLLPKMSLKMMTPSGPKDITTEELCANSKVVLFGVPGAFTPTCSAKHLPGFVDTYQQLRDHGVDKIACVSVNDAFVMDAWGKSCHTDDKVMMLADGNGTFTEALGLTLDAEGFGMGKRSQRYAMVVENGTVTQVHVEKPGEFKVSSAENILSHIQ